MARKSQFLDVWNSVGINVYVKYSKPLVLFAGMLCLGMFVNFVEIHSFTSVSTTVYIQAHAMYARG